MTSTLKPGRIRVYCFIYITLRIMSIRNQFRFITCKDRVNIGTWRLLVVLSIPLTLYAIFPGVIFWIIVHMVLWIKEGYDADKGISKKESHWHRTKEISEKGMGVCKECGTDVGYFNLDDGLCKICILKLSNENDK